MREGVELFANRTGTPLDSIDISTGDSVDFRLRHAIEERKGLHATVPLLSAPQIGRPAVSQLKKQIKHQINYMARLPATKNASRPFLIFIPGIVLFQDPNLDTLLAHARAANIAFVVTDNSMEALRTESKTSVDMILQQS